MSALNAIKTTSKLEGRTIKEIWKSRLNEKIQGEQVNVPLEKNPVTGKVQEVNKPLRDEYQGDAYHYTRSDVEFDQFDPWSGGTGDPWESIGVHVGTAKAAYERASSTRQVISPKPDTLSGSRYRGTVAAVSLGTQDPGHFLNLKFRKQKPFLKEDGSIYPEVEVRRELNKIAKSDEFFNYIKNNGYLEGYLTERRTTNNRTLEFWSEIVSEKKKQLKDTEDAISKYSNLSPGYLENAKKEIEKQIDEAEGKLGIAVEVRQDIEDTLKDPNKYKDDILNHFKRYAGPVLGEYLHDEKGYTVIPSINDTEDAGSISYVLLQPAHTARRTDAKFKRAWGGLTAGVAGAAVMGEDKKKEEFQIAPDPRFKKEEKKAPD